MSKQGGVCVKRQFVKPGLWRVGNESIRSVNVGYALRYQVRGKTFSGLHEAEAECRRLMGLAAPAADGRA